jgi:hypothetical protein
MRYLENCISELKDAAGTKPSRPTPYDSRNASATPEVTQQRREPAIDISDDSDEDMSDAVSPTTTILPKTLQPSPTLTRHANSIATSPAIYPVDRGSYSNTTSPHIQPSDPRHYSITSSIRSTATSPAVGPSLNPFHAGPSPSILPSPAYSAHGSTQAVHNFANLPATGPTQSRFLLTSPALKPQQDPGDKELDSAGSREDHEATAALLMLNSDRRSWSERSSSGSGAPSGRALGVKDLLSG